VAQRPAERRHLLSRALLLTVAIVLPVLVIAYFAAPLGLAVFGHQYVSGALGILRWLIVTALVTITNYVAGTVLYLAKKTLEISVINIVDAIIVIGLATAWARNAEGVAISWVIGDVCNTALFSLFAFVAVRHVGGRFEDLGGPADLRRDPVPARPTLLTSQQRALEVLLELSRLQKQSSIYSARDLTETQPGLGWAWEVTAVGAEKVQGADRQSAAQPAPRRTAGHRTGRR
jgi:hypothetical protein